jgi:hypothetical protein
MIDNVTIAFIGYLVGCLFRTAYDAIPHVSEPFDVKYIQTMFLSFLVSVMTAFVTFSSLPLPTLEPSYLFFSCLTTGFTINHIINKPLDEYTKAKEKKPSE